MIVKLSKSWTNVFGKKYPIGTPLQVHKDLGRKLIEDGYGEEYDGSRQVKSKTDFFKPKSKITWQ